MYEVATTLSTSKPNESSTPAKQIEDLTHANNVDKRRRLIKRF